MASAENQSRRNHEIVAARAAGRTLAELAKDHGLGLSRVKEILAEARQAGVLAVPATAAMRAAEARRGEYTEAVAEIRRLALALSDTQASAKVGALRLLVDALDRLTRLEQALGHLPRGLEQVSDDRDLLAMTVTVLRDHKVPEAVMHDLAARLEGGEQCAA
jgi:tetratricopeptide (TPR) repeat protein